MFNDQHFNIKPLNTDIIVKQKKRQKLFPKTKTKRNCKPIKQNTHKELIYSVHY